MPNKDFNSRTHQAETNRQLIIGAIVLVLLIGLAFVALRLGTGALFLAIGVFGAVGVMIVLVWLALKVIEWMAGSDES